MLLILTTQRLNHGSYVVGLQCIEFSGKSIFSFILGHISVYKTKNPVTGTGFFIRSSGHLFKIFRALYRKCAANDVTVLPAVLSENLYTVFEFPDFRAICGWVNLHLQHKWLRHVFV